MYGQNWLHNYRHSARPLGNAISYAHPHPYSNSTDKAEPALNTSQKSPSYITWLNTSHLRLQTRKHSSITMTRKACQQHIQKEMEKKGGYNYGEQDSENNVQSSMSSTSSSGMFHFSGSFRHSSVVDRKCRTWKTTWAVGDSGILLSANIWQYYNQISSGI